MAGEVRANCKYMPRWPPRRTPAVQGHARSRVPMKAIPGPVPTIGLLHVFNIFMTFARYGQLTVSSAPLAAVILVSRGIALFETVRMVQANRIGNGQAGPAAVAGGDVRKSPHPLP